MNWLFKACQSDPEVEFILIRLTTNRIDIYTAQSLLQQRLDNGSANNDLICSQLAALYPAAQPDGKAALGQLQAIFCSDMQNQEQQDQNQYTPETTQPADMLSVDIE